MKIILTDSFSKKHLAKLKKYFSESDFINKLTENRNNITLRPPYFKVKLKIRLVDFRGVILMKEGDYIIPLLLYLKKDKRKGENIIWGNYENEILKSQDLALLNIKQHKYKSFNLT